MYVINAQPTLRGHPGAQCCWAMSSGNQFTYNRLHSLRYKKKRDRTTNIEKAYVYVGRERKVLCL